MKGQEIAERALEFIQKEIVAIQIQNSEEVTRNTSLYRTGILDSLGLLRLVEFIEQEFGIEVSDEDVIPENFESANAIGSFVQSRQSAAGRASIHPTSTAT